MLEKIPSWMIDNRQEGVRSNLMFEYKDYEHER